MLKFPVIVSTLDFLTSPAEVSIIVDASSKYGPFNFMISVLVDPDSASAVPKYVTCLCELSCKASLSVQDQAFLRDLKLFANTVEKAYNHTNITSWIWCARLPSCAICRTRAVNSPRHASDGM